LAPCCSSPGSFSDATAVSNSERLFDGPLAIRPRLKGDKWRSLIIAPQHHDKESARRALAQADVEFLPGPWGNRVEIVGYGNIEFSKSPNVFRGMGLSRLSQNAQVIKELAEEGMALD
jgi:hypothetical protein